MNIFGIYLSQNLSKYSPKRTIKKNSLGEHSPEPLANARLRPNAKKSWVHTPPPGKSCIRPCFSICVLHTPTLLST